MDKWRLVTVAEIAAPHPNALATGPFGSAISARFFQASGVPVIRGSNLSESTGERLIERDMAFLSPEKAREFHRSIARRNDLILTCWGTIGQVGLIDAHALFDEYIVSNKQMKFTPDPNKADSLFLYYCFSGPEVSSSIINQAIGSSVPGFNLGQLKKIHLRLPPLDEQLAIARVLGVLDDKIELNQRMNETLEEMARTLFRSWFIDFDPVRAKMAGRAPAGMDALTARVFPEHLEEGVPKGWRITSLAEATAMGAGEVQTGPFGSQLHASDYVDHGIPVVMPTNIRNRRVDSADIARIAPADVDRLSRHQLRVGDLVYSRRGDVEKHAIVGPEEAGWLCGTGCLRVRPAAEGRVGISPHFLSLWLDLPTSREWIARWAWCGTRRAAASR